MIEGWLIGRLKAEIAEAAVEGLRAPSGRDAFELGRLHGQICGLSRALEILEDKLAERDRDDDEREGDRFHGFADKRTR